MTTTNITSMLASLLTITISIYILFGLYLYLNQRDILYHPAKAISHNYEKKVFNVNRQKIVVTVLNRDHKKALIYFGGNAETVDYNIQNFIDTFDETTLYLVNYRGYGGSSGKPTEASLYTDALGIYDQISSHYDTISLIGRSLGSGVATYLASQRPIEKLILITPFDSIKNVAQETFPWYPMSLLLKDQYRSVDRVHNVTAPTLLLIAQNDEIVSYQRSKALIETFPHAQIVVKILKDTTHNSISYHPLYYSYMRNFLYR